MRVANGIRLLISWHLDREINLYYPAELIVIKGSLNVEEGEESEWCQVRNTWKAFATFEGTQPQLRKAGSLQKLRKIENWTLG